MDENLVLNEQQTTHFAVEKLETRLEQAWGDMSGHPEEPHEPYDPQNG